MAAVVRAAAAAGAPSVPRDLELVGVWQQLPGVALVDNRSAVLLARLCQHQHRCVARLGNRLAVHFAHLHVEGPHGRPD